jgi:YfiH family protein
MMMLHSAALGAVPGVRHGFFTRMGGVSDGLYASLNGGLGSSDTREHVSENRARMAAALGVAAADLLTPFQVHSPDVAVADHSWKIDARPKVDALVTATAGLAIGISTADCGPILFADPAARVVGAAHAGWKGALTGVIESTIRAMEGLGASRARIVAAMGPMIRQPNYEVGAEFVARFAADAPANGRFFVPSRRAGHALFDLAGYIRSRLEGAGIGAIDDLGLCTYAEETRFYSYRRSVHRGEPDYGRHVHAIVLER